MSEADDPDGLAEGTLISHLLELRDRLLKMMLAVGICFIPCAIYMNQLFTFVADPLIHKLPAGSTLIATSVVAPFTVPFKLALVLAIGIAMPVVLYQAWAFVAPGGNLWIRGSATNVNSWFMYMAQGMKQIPTASIILSRRSRNSSRCEIRVPSARPSGSLPSLMGRFGVGR